MQHQKQMTQQLIIVFLYAAINSFIAASFDFTSYKRNKEAEEKLLQEYNNIREEHDKTGLRINELDSKLRAKERKLSISHTIYLKELNQLEKENNFLKNMLLQKYNDKISKEQLEEMLNAEMKRFSRKKYKYLTYDDVYNMLEASVKK